MRTRSLSPDCVAVPPPHVNTARLPLADIQIYLQSLLKSERHTKYCGYLLARSINYITEYNRQSTEILRSTNNNLWGLIGRKSSPSSDPPAVQYELLNQNFDQILQRINQFYQRIMIKTWPQRQNIENEINENHATLLLFELDQQLIFTILESDHVLNQYKLQEDQQTRAWGCHFLAPLVMKMVIFSIVLCWC